MRAGLPIHRDPGEPTPCHKCPKIPRGAKPEPASACEFNDRNRRAYDHWCEGRAVEFSDDEKRDPIVRRNAAIFQHAYDEFNRQPLRELATTMALMLEQMKRG